MIDLHSHILPGIDDGADSVEESLKMAQMCVEDGVTHLACTPHIMPQVYENTTEKIISLVTKFQKILELKKIPLTLVVGADAHLCHDMLEKLQDKRIPTLGQSNYFLFEPPHHVAPPTIVPFAQTIIANGFRPILTHPERLSWIENHYETMCKLGEVGAVVQITAQSITGGFGKRALYWSERMLDEGRVDIIASDAHNVKRRPPGLSKARDLIAKRLGESAASLMTIGNPGAILSNKPVAPKKNQHLTSSKKPKRSMFSWLK